jgi:hypothetical protein
MSGDIKHIDVDSDEYEDTPRALRDYVKKLQKQYQSVTTELDGVKTSLASKAVSDVLAGKNFKNPKRVEAVLLADGVDPLDSGAVQGWLEKYADDFARDVVEDEPTTPDASQEQVHPDAAALERMNLNGQPAAAVTAYEAATAEIPADATPEQVLAIFKRHGI